MYLLEKYPFMLVARFFPRMCQIHRRWWISPHMSFIAAAMAGSWSVKTTLMAGASGPLMAENESSIHWKDSVS